MSEPIRLSRNELDAPKVDEALAQEAAYRGAWAEGSEGGEAVGSVQRSKSTGGRGEGVYITGVTTTTLLGMFGALLGWGIFEPVAYENTDSVADGLYAIGMLVAVITGAATFISMGDGLLSRAWSRAGMSGLVGFGLGIVGGAVATFVANIIFSFGLGMMLAILMGLKPHLVRQLQRSPDDLPFAIMIGAMGVRAFAWASFGVALGLGPGIYQKSRDLKMVGLLGGVCGGFLGGLFFDPIEQSFGTDVVSRCIGFGLTGALAGFAIGAVEQLAKDSWLFMEDGPLAGKQFVLYKDPTRIGSSPKCDVYIFKDPDVEPRHAELSRVGGSHEIRAIGSAPVIVNGKRTNRQRLEDGDQIRIGRARFRYYVRREKRKKVS